MTGVLYQVSLLFPANTFTIKTDLIMLLTTVNLHCTKTVHRSLMMFFLCATLGMALI